MLKIPSFLRNDIFGLLSLCGQIGPLLTHTMLLLGFVYGYRLRFTFTAYFDCSVCIQAQNLNIIIEVFVYFV